MPCCMPGVFPCRCECLLCSRTQAESTQAAPPLATHESEVRPARPRATTRATPSLLRLPLIPFKVMEYITSLLPEGDMTLAQITACADIAIKLLDTDEANDMPSDMRDELLRLIAQCAEVETLTPAAQEVGSRLRFLVVSFVMLHDDESSA
jgi:hypothetical protein